MGEYIDTLCKLVVNVYVDQQGGVLEPICEWIESSYVLQTSLWS
jgi:hypothetical protein